MKYQKGLIFICLIICLFSIASVCASDVNEIVIASDDQSNDVVEIDDEHEDILAVDEQEVGNIGATEENELSASSGTFTDLADDIRWSNEEFNLTKNYVYSTNDANYKKGIDINNKITINGNGFTIDGNSLARVFNIKSDHVTLKNINFVNCYASDDENDCSGGAIVFSANNGIISDCNFVKCFARGNGGAISQKDWNSWDFNIINCNFTDNKASQCGGAISSGYNSQCNVMNCTFTSNTARLGGATSYVYSKNSFFNNNHASEKGGAMYKGTEYNCIFIGNTADISNINAYETDMSRSTLNISNLPSTCEYGSKLKFNFTTIEGQPIKFATITIKVYKDDTLVGTYKSLSGDGWVVRLSSGSYEIICTIENQDYLVNSASKIITVTKLNTNIYSSGVTTVYNNGKYLVATLKDNNGKPISGVQVTINLNGVKTLTTDSNGQVKLTTNGLAPKTYTTTITFAGNTNYAKSSTTAKVTVKKATPKLTANKKTFKKSLKTKKYTVTLKDNQNKAMKNIKVTIKVNKKTYTAKTNAKGKATFKIKKLTKKGTYKATLTYKGNSYYNKVTKKVNIKIK